MRKSLNISRRRFVQQLGGASIALPFYDVLLGGKLGHAACSDNTPKRIFFFYHPDGIPDKDGEKNYWKPTNINSLPYCLQALQSFSGDMVYFDNLDYIDVGQGGHAEGAQMCLTGGDRGHNNAMSFDKYLARAIGANDSHSHLCLGALTHKGMSEIVWESSGVPGSFLTDPHLVWDSLFKGGEQQNTSVTSKEKSIIDQNLKELNALKSMLGSAEKTKLDLHMESLREVEKRFNFSGSCGIVPEPSDADPNNTDQLHRVLKDQIDIAFEAMKCGKTRVSTILMAHHTYNTPAFLDGTSISRESMTNKGIQDFNTNYHATSHDDTSHFKEYKHWVCEQVAYLAQKLKDTEEPTSGCSGSMLDNSLIYVFSELGYSQAHSYKDVGVFTLGGGGGAVSGGRIINCNGNRVGSLFTSMARMFGQNIDGYNQGNGPISEFYS
jgi:hypothetical protein